MVDLLGRAGDLQEAHHLIQSMPMWPNSVNWGTINEGISPFFVPLKFDNILSNPTIALQKF